MHLAIITPYPPRLTGIGQYGYYISGALARSGVFERVTILTETAGRPELAAVQGQKAASPEPGLEIERIWEPGRLDLGWRILSRLWSLKPDLVWFNLGASAFGRSPLANLSGLFSPLVSRKFNLPCVVTLHEMVEQTDLRRLGAPGGPLASWGARLVTYAGTRADVVCVTLRRHAEWLSEHWPGTRVAHIPLGSYDSPRLLNASEQPEILIFCSFSPFKGLELLLSAFRELQSRHPHLRLTVAGGEHPRFPGYLANVRKVSGNHSNIRWMGSIPESGLEELFRQASIVALPYTATTGSSSVLYRAAAFGRPIVSSDLPELAAVAGDVGLCVEFFRSGDQDSLVQALDRLLKDPVRRQIQVVHNLRVVSQMTLSETSRAYLRAFDWAMTSGAHPVRLAAKTHHGQEIL